MSYQEIELSRIKPNPSNPRKHFDGPKFDELVDSIRIKGILQPIVIRPKDEIFEIVAGERRWKAACKIAEENGGLQDQKIPAMVPPHSHQ
jgi:ParB/RepB/Spo0J family partition protein